MGQGQSAEISPPWIPAPGSRYPNDIEQAIIDLAQSEETFLSAAPDHFPQAEFILDDHYEEIEAVVQYDNQLAIQAERLVPSKVTEQEFWGNYFSHVNVLREKGNALLAEIQARDKSEAEKVVEKEPESKSQPADSPIDTTDADAESNIDARIAEYVKAAVALPSAPNINNQIRWGIVGAISERMLQALSINKLSTVVGSIGHSSPQNTKKLKEFSHATDMITSSNIDAVYIGECSTDNDCIDLCKLALQNGKHYLVDSYRAFCSAYALSLIDSHSHVSALWPVLSFSPRFALIAELIEKNHLGSIGNIVYQFSIPSKDLNEVLPLNCSPFEWSAAPVLEIFDFMFGPLLHVQGYVKRCADVAGAIPYEDSAVFHFHIGSGAIGCAVFNFNSSVREDRLTIDCSLGRILLPVFTEEVPKVEINGNAIEIPELHTGNDENIPANEIRFIYSFIGGCKSGRNSSFSQRQKRVGKLLDIILRSYYGDRHDYFWTRPETWESASV